MRMLTPEERGVIERGARGCVCAEGTSRRARPGAEYAMVKALEQQQRVNHPICPTCNTTGRTITHWGEKALRVDDIIRQLGM